MRSIATAALIGMSLGFGSVSYADTLLGIYVGGGSISYDLSGDFTDLEGATYALDRLGSLTLRRHRMPCAHRHTLDKHCMYGRRSRALQL